jgi:hypothetical protein
VKRPAVRTFRTAGAEVSIQPHKQHCTIRIRTDYPMPDAIRYDIIVELQLHAARPHVQPQIGARGGFCSHIRADKAQATAQRVLMVARRGYIKFLERETVPGRSEAAATDARPTCGPTLTTPGEGHQGRGHAQPGDNTATL